MNADFYFFICVYLRSSAVSGLFCLFLHARADHDVLTLRARHRALDEHEVALHVHFHDLEIQVGARHIAQVAGHGLARKHAARRLALTDRARGPVAQRVTMTGATTAKMMALDRAGKTLTNRRAL